MDCWRSSCSQRGPGGLEPWAASAKPLGAGTGLGWRLPGGCRGPSAPGGGSSSAQSGCSGGQWGREAGLLQKHGLSSCEPDAGGRAPLPAHRSTGLGDRLDTHTVTSTQMTTAGEGRCDHRGAASGFTRRKEQAPSRRRTPAGPGGAKRPARTEEKGAPPSATRGGGDAARPRKARVPRLSWADGERHEERPRQCPHRPVLDAVTPGRMRRCELRRAGKGNGRVRPGPLAGSRAGSGASAGL